MSATTPAAWRRITATVLGAGAIAIGGMALLAPAANAQPVKSEAQTECGSEESGDVYTSGTNSSGTKVEKCCYEGMLGVTHCDVWVGGKWNKDLSFREATTAPPVVVGPRPIPPGSISPEHQITPSKTPVVLNPQGSGTAVRK